MNTTPTVGPMIRAWRSSRKKSQLALAVEAGVSTRHLSFVETGRSNPSREMVLLLAERLELPLRERNALLEAAGYAAVYRETPLDAPALADVRGALQHILEGSEPNPTLVVNRRYDVLLANDAAVRLLSYFAPEWRGKNNVALMLFSAQGLRSSIANWAEVTEHVVRRMLGELSTLRAPTPADVDMMTEVRAVDGELRSARPAVAHHTILVPVVFRRGGIELELFTTITTLGTPLDITLQELRIESFFPASPGARDALQVVMRAEDEADDRD